MHIKTLNPLKSPWHNKQ